MLRTLVLRAIIEALGKKILERRLGICVAGSDDLPLGGLTTWSRSHYAVSHRWSRIFCGGKLGRGLCLAGKGQGSAAKMVSKSSLVLIVESQSKLRANSDAGLVCDRYASIRVSYAMLDVDHNRRSIYADPLRRSPGYLSFMRATFVNLAVGRLLNRNKIIQHLPD
ncbi:hypothetical protein EVAR_58870_1 [Eumeta japonica]|uniref:Uncharacterized protein n=1 Tax=Eumeta variegata TaxID=151549 RepID=A0A4C1Y8X3_EUMVA|nr:hypothetical protein EVAR_58870_1 [Eumeta japonica]